jgi:signal transduction histidine kinase
VTIDGFLRYIEKDIASGNMERFKVDMQRVQGAVNKMQRLLMELLELSRIGRMSNEMVTVPFEEIIREAMEAVHGRLETSGVRTVIQSGLPSVVGDRPRLVEVMQNLIDNAAKYIGHQKEPFIEIGMRGMENDKPIFFVKDNGMGIDPKHHNRIFELFNKLEATTEGTGVGLALVKRIIEVHGGRIWVESESGQGSSFYFTLPTNKETI